VSLGLFNFSQFSRIVERRRSFSFLPCIFYTTLTSSEFLFWSPHPVSIIQYCLNIDNRSKKKKNILYISSLIVNVRWRRGGNCFLISN
jgi:hypothetical protein